MQMNLDTPITHLMVPDPITVEVGQSLADVRRALSGERIHHLPVLQHGKLVGMISFNDLLEYGAADPEAATAGYLDQHLSIRSVMCRDVIGIGHRATVGEAARLLSAGGFHALPVVDDDQHLHGLLTSTDLIDFLLEAGSEAPRPINSELRLKALEHVFKAAELFLHSGLAETEHARLERAIDAAR